MNVDQALLGETVVKLMDQIENNPPPLDEGYSLDDLKMISVGIIVVFDSGDSTFVRIESSEQYHHHQLGLFENGLEVARQNAWD